MGRSTRVARRSPACTPASPPRSTSSSLAHPGELVAICTHGGVVDVAMRIGLRLPVRGWFDLFTLNTSLTEMTDTGVGRWRIDRYNDAAHLLDGFWP